MKAYIYKNKQIAYNKNMSTQELNAAFNSLMLKDTMHENPQITIDGIGCYAISCNPVTKVDYDSNFDERRKKLLNYPRVFGLLREWLYTQSNRVTRRRICPIGEVKTEWERRFNESGEFDNYAPVGVVLLAARSCGFPMVDRDIGGIVLVDLDPKYLIRAG